MATVDAGDRLCGRISCWGIERLDKDAVHSAADIMRNYDDKVSKLLDAGIDVLIYVGVGKSTHRHPIQLAFKRIKPAASFVCTSASTSAPLVSLLYPPINVSD